MRDRGQFIEQVRARAEARADVGAAVVAMIERLRSDPGADATLRRGFRVLVDRVGLAPLLERVTISVRREEARAMLETLLAPIDERPAPDSIG